MSREERTALVSVLVTLLVGAGVAAAGSQGGATVWGVPVFALAVLLAFVVQWAAFVVAYARQTERFYDLVGSLTHITVVCVAAGLSGSVGPRSALLLVLVVVWAGRLGTFLVRRIRAAGADSRFDEMKPSFLRFLNAWNLQGLWIALTQAAALAAVTTGAAADGLDAFAFAGAGVWLTGFAFEAVADDQKRRFRKDPANKGAFIRTGLWAWSRHPNYFGEILLWVGVAVIALPALQGAQYLTLISPVFVAVLLIRISGVPMLEAAADERWGGQEEYEEYKRRTPVLVPLPPGVTGRGK